MFAERFGSYSIAATFAGTPSFVRLKSITRYRRLWPPPWWRVVTRPALLRPPFLVTGSSSDFSGVDFVTSSKVETVMKRLPADVGLYLRTGIGVGVLLAENAQHFLRHHRREQDLVRVQAHAHLPCTSGSAASVTTSVRAHTSSEISSSEGTVT